MEPAMIAMVQGEVAVRRARPRRRARRPASATASRSPPRRCAACPRSASSVTLHAHLVVREDALNALRLRDRGGARPVPAADRRAERRAEGRAGRALRRRRRASSLGALGDGRRRAPAGRARRRQAHRGAHRRRAAAEVRRRTTAIRSPAATATTRARSPATACSSSATRRRRPTRLLDGAAGETARGPASPTRSRRRADERPDPAHPTTPASPTEDDLDRLAAPAAARGLRRPAGACASSSRSRSRPPPRAARRSTTSCSPARPGLGKTSLAQIVAARAGRRRSCRPPARRSSARATSPRFLTALSRAASSSSTRCTGCRARWRRPSIPRWRTAGCRSRSARAPARSVVTLDLPPFTLVGATTRTGLLTTPLRDRFGIQHRLDPYDAGRPRADRAALRARSSASQIESAGARAIAARSRGTPRVANRLLKRVRDYAAGPRRRRRSTPPPPTPRSTLLGDRHEGLDRLDRELLRAICDALRRRARRALDARRRGRRGGRTRSRTSTSRTCSSAASSSARRAGALRHARPRLERLRREPASRSSRHRAITHGDRAERLASNLRS